MTEFKYAVGDSFKLQTGEVIVIKELPVNQGARAYAIENSLKGCCCYFTEAYLDSLEKVGGNG